MNFEYCEDDEGVRSGEERDKERRISSFESGLLPSSEESAVLRRRGDDESFRQYLGTGQ